MHVHAGTCMYCMMIFIYQSLPCPLVFQSFVADFQPRSRSSSFLGKLEGQCFLVRIKCPNEKRLAFTGGILLLTHNLCTGSLSVFSLWPPESMCNICLETVVASPRVLSDKEAYDSYLRNGVSKPCSFLFSFQTAA